MSKMKVATFVIGTADDFGSIQDLIEYVEENGTLGSRNYSVYTYDYPAECSEELVVAMGRGFAFGSDWCLDHTVSFVVDGELD